MKELLVKIDEKLSELFNYWLWENPEDDFAYKLMELLKNEHSFDEEEIKDFFEEFYDSISYLESSSLDVNFDSIFTFQIGYNEIIIYYEDFCTETYLKEFLLDVYDYKSLEKHFIALFGDKAEAYYDNFYIDNIIDLEFKSMGSIDDTKVFVVDKSQIIEIGSFYVIIK